MPIINVKFIEGVVATPDQKHELVAKLTDAFVGVLGDVVKPFTYVVIEETKVGDWGIAGKPMPDLAYLVGDEYAAVREKANDIMRGVIAQMAAAGPSSNGGGGMTGEQAKALFNRWFGEVWNKGNYDVAYEVIDPEFAVHGAGGQKVKTGPEGVIELVKTWRNAFPNGRMIIQDVIAQGDLVYVRMHWVGTHLGDFYGIPPTGATVKVTSVGLDRVSNGKVVEGWGELDMVGMMQSLGALPPFGTGAVASRVPATWGDDVSSKGEAGAGEDVKAIAAKFAQAAISGDRDAASQLADPATYAEHNPVWGSKNFEGTMGVAANLRAAFPDLNVAIDPALTVAEGNTVGVHAVVSGTHTGADLFDVPASGKRVTWTHSEIDRVVGGKVVERWICSDTLTLAQQAGVIPSPGGSAPAEDEHQASPASTNGHGPAPDAAAALESNKAKVALLHDALNRKDFTALGDILADNFVNHSGAKDVQTGADAFASSFMPLIHAMPDFHINNVSVTAQHDRVSVRVGYSGVHQRNYMGIAPATGRTINWTGIVIYRLDENGKIAERWEDSDNVGLMTQLGVIPVPAAT